MNEKRIQGHVLIIEFENYDKVMKHLASFGMYGVEQISIQKVEGRFVVSRPLPKDERSNWKWLYDRCKKRVTPVGPNDDPDGTPPGGGTPGTPVIVEQTFTEARAA